MLPATRLARLTINGEEKVVAFPTHHTLLEVLREECGLPGTKHGCELGECGTCTVLLDGMPVLSCLALAVEAEGKAIETVEGLAHGNELHPLQAAFADLGAAQCGYCTPGILMAAKAFLAENPAPSEDDIRAALAGNLCRCTGYQKILEAVAWAAAMLRGETTPPPREAFFGAPEPGVGQTTTDGRTHGSAPTPRTGPSHQGEHVGPPLRHDLAVGADPCVGPSGGTHHG